MAAAPLIAAGMPAAALSALLPHRFENCADPLATSPLISAALFALCLWFWHTPHAYAETFTSVLMYWLMHLTLFGSAIWLWAGLINDRPATTLQAAAASVVSSIQMGLLGAIIMFAPRPLYSPHALTTATWGLSQLQDQQLGGVIMWVPGCIIFLTVALLRLMAILRPPVWEQRVSFFPLEQARSRMDL